MLWNNVGSDKGMHSYLDKEVKLEIGDDNGFEELDPTLWIRSLMYFFEIDATD